MCTAPGDYASATTQYTFMPGDTRLDIPVTIVDDSNFEDQERFLGSLSTSNPNAVIDEPMTQVFINDNDCKFLLIGAVTKYHKTAVYGKRVNYNIIIMPS